MRDITNKRGALVRDVCVYISVLAVRVRSLALFDLAWFCLILGRCVLICFSVGAGLWSWLRHHDLMEFVVLHVVYFLLLGLCGTVAILAFEGETDREGEREDSILSVAILAFESESKEKERDCVLCSEFVCRLE